MRRKDEFGSIRKLKTERYDGMNHSGMNPLSLLFRKQDESDFSASKLQTNAKNFQWSFFFLALGYALFFVFSADFTNVISFNPDKVLFFATGSILIILLLMSFLKSLRLILPVFESTAIVVIGVSLVGMLILNGNKNYLVYTLALAVLTSYNYIFSGRTFLHTLLIGWLLFIALIVVVIFKNLTITAAQTLMPIVILIINLIGVYINYSLEKLRRLNYMQHRALRETKERIVVTRDILSKKESSLNQLAHINEELISKIEKNRQNEKSLKIKLEIEKLITNLSIQFIRLSPDKIDKVIIFGLRSITEYSQVDRSYIYLFCKNKTELVKTHQWCAKDVKSKIDKHEAVDKEDFEWFRNTLERQDIIRVSKLEELPHEATTQKAIFKVEAAKSMLIVPLVDDEQVRGLIGMDTVHNEREWNEEDTALLMVAGSLFINALARKREIENKRESEQKLRRLFERSEDVVFITTPEGRFVDVNPAGARLFGYDSVEEMKAVDIERDIYVNPEDRHTFKKKLEMEGHLKDYELILKSKDGKTVIVLETTTAVRNKDGDIVAYEGIMRDVTEKRLLENQLIQSQKMESIGLLAGGIAHDFNNILTAINGYADMILRKMNTDHPFYADIQNIIKGGKRAENLTRQLLAFSRKQIIEPKIVDINQIISDLYKMLKRLISEDIQLELHTDKDIGRIQADPGQIEQVMVNLIINARDAIRQKKDKTTPKKIIVETSNTTLNAEFVKKNPGSREGHYARITVRDSGIGMDETTLRKIFEPFFTTKEEGQGTGLGLSTVYGIVKQNEGYVLAESKPGVGTAVTIYWPVTRSEDESETRGESSEILNDIKETILVVEDDNDVRDLARSFLTSLGYKVYEAANGKSALDLIKKEQIIDKIDLLLTDMVMPHMDGEELAENINKMRGDIKIILTSGYTDSKLMKSGLLERGYYFLPKPYTIQQMAKKIRKVLNSDL